MDPKIEYTSTYQTFIKLLSEILLHLHNRGWNPLTPITIGSNEKRMITICFEKREDAHLQLAGFYRRISSQSHASDHQSASSLDTPLETLCCSVECHGASLILHSLPATVISDLVSVYIADIIAVSSGVMSVIQDYIENDLPVVQGNIKYIQLRKQSGPENKTNIIACLSRAGFKLSVVISISSTISVYFFIMEKRKSDQLRQLSKQKAGLGMRDSLVPFQPIVNRRKSSFFRSFNGRTSLRRRVEQSVIRKVGPIKAAQTDWFRQTSTDTGTDSEFEDIEDDNVDNL